MDAFQNNLSSLHHEELIPIVFEVVLKWVRKRRAAINNKV